MEAENINKPQSPALQQGVVKRSYSEMADELLKQMFFSSPNNSVEWVRFTDNQIRDYVVRTREYIEVSGSNQYLYRTERYSMKANIKKHLLKKGVRYNGAEYKYAKSNCNYA